MRRHRCSSTAHSSRCPASPGAAPPPAASAARRSGRASSLWGCVLLGLAILIAAVAHGRAQAAEAGGLEAATAARFAELALACVHKEYPNKLSHVLNGDEDVRPPRQLTPAFFGCFDWHSAVHGHWLLARLVRRFPTAPFTPRALAALARSLTTENLVREAEYLRGKGRQSFERPYGLAWLLQLAAELAEWDSPTGRSLSAALVPLERAAVERLSTWLPKLSRPVRSGEHSQTAFALGLVLDYARTRRPGEPAPRDAALEALVLERARTFYLGDRACPVDYEPSGEDFLSPCLAEADLMRRVLPPAEFAAWLGGFLPPAALRTLRPQVVTDPSDGKLAHLDGLNLSRASMLEGLVSALAPSDPRRAELSEIAAAHRAAGLRSVTGAHYEGGHWLGSFATYLVTGRGLAGTR